GSACAEKAVQDLQCRHGPQLESSGEQEFVKEVAREVVDEMVWMDQRAAQTRSIFDRLCERDAVPVVNSCRERQIDNDQCQKQKPRCKVSPSHFWDRINRIYNPVLACCTISRLSVLEAKTGGITIHTPKHISCVSLRAPETR